MLVEACDGVSSRSRGSGGCVCRGKAVLPNGIRSGTHPLRQSSLLPFRGVGSQPDTGIADRRLRTRAWHDGQTAQPLGIRDAGHASQSSDPTGRPLDSSSRPREAGDSGERKALRRTRTLHSRLIDHRPTPVQPVSATGMRSPPCQRPIPTDIPRGPSTNPLQTRSVYATVGCI